MKDAQIDLLGRFEVRIDGRPVPERAFTRRSAAALVKVLALAPGRVLHREQLLDALWPELPPADARPRLHTATHYARRALGHAAGVVLRGHLVLLLPDVPVEVDVIRFTTRAGTALETGAAADIESAIAAARGGMLLPDDRFEPWAEAERERVRRLFLDVLRVGRRWDGVLRLEPADEQAHLELMRTAAARGDRRGALRQFERLEQALRTELGTRPSAEAMRLRDELEPDEGERTTRLPRLLARRPVLERLDQALAQVRQARGSTVLVTGVPGAGTSSVLAWARARGMSLGTRVGTGAASAAEGGWPYGPVLEALSDLCRRHPALLEGLDDAYRREIERALRGGELSWSGDGGHQRLFVSVGELVRLAAAGTGVVLTVDDLHEADEGSLRLLHYLARTASSEPVVLVLGSHNAPPDSPLGRMRASLTRRAGVTELPLAPLPLPATTALLTASLGHPVDETTARDIHRVSRGLPRQILELAPSVDRLGSEPLPLDRLLADCPPGAEEVLRRCAVLGPTVTTDEFVALSGADEATAFAVLEAGLDVGVLEPSGHGCRFRHELYRKSLLADLPPHRLQRLHAEVAEALDAMHGSPVRIAQHLLAADDRVAAVPWLLRAAENYASVGAYRDALALVEQARSGPDTAERPRLLAIRAHLLLAVGDRHAVAAYREAATETTGEQRRTVLARLALAASMAGDADTANEAVAELDAQGGPADSSILMARGIVAYFRGDLETASAATDEARRTLGPTSDWRLLELITLQGLIAHDRGEWFRRLRHELQRTREAPALATAIFDAHLCVAEYLLYGPTPYPEVLALGRALRETAQQAGALRAVAFACALTGEAALLSGDLATAERDLTEAIDLHAELASPAGEAHALQRLAEVRVAQGNRAEARRLLRRAEPLARWSPIALHLLQRIHGTVIAAADTPEAAHAAAEAAESTAAPEDECRFCQIMLSAPSAIACADVGDLEGARRHLAAAERSAAFWHGTAWQGALLEARAHLARAERDGGAARRLFAEAAACFEAAGQPRDAHRCRSSAAAPVPAPRRSGSTTPTL